ncbi:hypothetical protein PR048_001766 [Dryococelus australis]|uniref:Uncharacterized protein n=1 Tax=Dryococelus australis TaxID=614101 RepID=A0ABQ9IJ00_9NEOP|nr:hypothetical protein PR048_001766 [Dryococelus australis]
MAKGGGVKLPPALYLQSKNAYAEWKFWESEFEDYLVSTGQDNAADMAKISLYGILMGSTSSRILATLAIPDDDRNNYIKKDTEAEEDKMLHNQTVHGV